MKVIPVEIRGTLKQRTVNFLCAFREAPDDEDIAVCSGPAHGDGITFPAVMIEIGGRFYGFTAHETQFVVEVAEAVADEFPGINVSAFRKLIAALLNAADLAERDVSGFQS